MNVQALADARPKPFSWAALRLREQARTGETDRMVENRVEHGLSGLRRRRLLARVLVGMVAAAVPAVLIAAHNPWRYVYLIPLGRTPVVVTVLALSPVMLGSATWLFMGKKRSGRMVAAFVVASTVFMCAVGYWVSEAESIFEEVDSEGARTVVAVSPGGAFDLVVIDYPVFTARYEIVRIRSRAGLTSREAGQDLACFAEIFGQFDPENTFESARFVGEHKVEVRTEAGESWATNFDPNTLLAGATVSRGCEE